MRIKIKKRPKAAEIELSCKALSDLLIVSKRLSDIPDEFTSTVTSTPSMTFETDASIQEIGASDEENAKTVIEISGSGVLRFKKISPHGMLFETEVSNLLFFLQEKGLLDIYEKEVIFQKIEGLDTVPAPVSFKEGVPVREMYRKAVESDFQTRKWVYSALLQKG